MRKQVKIAAFAALLAVGFTANAQTDATLTGASEGTKSVNTTKAKKAGEVIELIDRKGTRKYLQANNGITTITSKAPGNRTVTTWQLGGELLEETYITAGDKKEFNLDGLKLVKPLSQKEYDKLSLSDQALPENKARLMSSNATDRSKKGATGANAPGTGFTVIIRDEATGAIQKADLSEILNVTGVLKEYTADADYDATTTATGQAIDSAGNTYTFDVAGVPAITGASDTKASKLYVFRNGAKLRIDTDFTATTAGKIVINTNEVPVYKDDVIEIHY